MFATARRRASDKANNVVRRIRRNSGSGSGSVSAFPSPFPASSGGAPGYFSPSFRPSAVPPTSPSSSSSSSSSSSLSSSSSSSSSPSPSSSPLSSLSSLLFPPPSAYSQLRPLRVLGLESSADDACAAVVTSDRKVLSSVVMKQHRENQKWGGIHPIMAQEAHLRDMPLAIEAALSEANMTVNDIDAVAYTRGPGMFGCLTICATSARAIAAATGKPLVGVHHMQAHALTPLLTEDVPPQFPFLTLLVSGGHTQLVLAESMDKFSILMTTLDNAIGDVFDKTARFLKLPHSNERGLGPVLEEYAAAAPLPPYDTTPLAMPKPLARNRERGNLAFSFAGLLAHSERVAKAECGGHVDGDGEIPLAVQREVSRAFQAAAVGHVVDKIRQCIEANKLKVKGLVVSGGVGSNKYLREELRKMLGDLDGVTLHYPPIAMCTDNAAMIAWVAIVRMQAGLKGEPFDLPLRKKWSLEDLYDDVPPECYK